MLEKVWAAIETGEDLVVSSPPGAGKTTLVSALAHRAEAEGRSLTIACPTVHGASVVAEHFTGTGIASLQGGSMPNVPGVPTVRKGEATTPVVIRTVASCRIGPPDDDLMVFDEAYQTTFADALVASSRAGQVIMVGDPGQIGPVNALDITAFDLTVSPAARAPEPLLERGLARHLSLPHTYRLGPETTAAIAPLYPFDFDTRRPAARVVGRWEIEAVDLGECSSLVDENMLRAVLSEIVSLIGSRLYLRDQTRALRPEDIAVVVARNEQLAAIEAALMVQEIEGVTVGTADSLQGGQWPSVVALDPMVGRNTSTDHSMSLGRLCVMISRHIAHLTWVTATTDVESTLASVEDIEAADLHSSVRATLLGEAD